MSKPETIGRTYNPVTIALCAKGGHLVTVYSSWLDISSCQCGEVAVKGDVVRKRPGGTRSGKEVPVDLNWRKASASNSQGNCLELAKGPNGEILLRESDDPELVVETTPDKLGAFFDGVRKGEFDDLIA